MINSTMTGVAAAHHGRHHNDSQDAQNFKALSSALKSGDLAGAQKAFQALTANSSSASSSQNATSNSPFANDLNAIGQALSSGDLSGAQKAFATLQTDFQARRAQQAPAAQPQASADADGDSDGSGGISVNISA